MYIYIYIHTIYIYIYTHICIYIYIYIYIYIFYYNILTLPGASPDQARVDKGRTARGAEAEAIIWPRDNMVGVNMVPA